MYRRMMWNHAKITSDIIFWYIESMHITVLITCKIDFSRIRMYDYVDKVIRGLLGVIISAQAFLGLGYSLY